MEILEKYMPLESGEEIVCHLEGDAYSVSPNIFVRIFAFIERIFAILIGSPKKAHVIVTNRRVIIVEIQKFLWFFIGSTNAKSVMPRSIGSLGYQFTRSFIFFKSHFLEFNSGNVTTLVKSKSGKDRVYEMIKSIVNLAEKISTK
jgi:hypothetical protein